MNDDKRNAAGQMAAQNQEQPGKGRKLRGKEPGVDYFELFKWFWDTAPFIDGFKHSTGFLFLAVVDSLNRNFWNPVQLSLEVILNKVKLDKKTYLKSRQWLIDNKFLTVDAGKNNYTMARFSLGAAVEKSPADSPGISSSIPPLYTPASPPNIKQETINNKTKEGVGPPTSFKNFSEQEFLNEINTYPEFAAQIRQQFFDYWREKSPRGKMKFQLQNTWETKLRLQQWERRSNQFKNNHVPNGSASKKIVEYIPEQ